MTATVSTPHFSRQFYLHAREGRGRNRQSEDYPRCADAADKKKRKKNSLSLCAKCQQAACLLFLWLIFTQICVMSIILSAI